MSLRSLKIISFITLVMVATFSCKKNKTETPETPPVPLTPYTVNYPDYFPTMDVPADNPLTVEGINLGRYLYYDTIMSNDGRSCSTCHNSGEAFSASAVNSLPHINLAWNTNFLWNGKVSGSIEDIMRFEVESFFNTNIAKLNNSAFYREQFKKVYNVETISSQNVAYALSQFFRVLVSSNSLCDKFFQHTGWLDNSQLNGFIIFTTEKGDCFHCHNVGLFNDNKFHNIGLDSVFTGVNRGRYNITAKPSDMGLFKTPTLRNIELTPPYMHDGRYLTLDAVVEHYNSKVKQSATLDPIMTKPSKLFGLGLTATEKQDLVAFLKTLTDSTFINNPMLQKPQ